MKFLYLGIFGLLGVFVRYFIDAKYATNEVTFPISTFALNMFGCLIAGIVSFYFNSRQDNIIAAAILIGFCGGLTTFSGFSLQTLNLFDQGLRTQAFIYFVICPPIGLIMAYLGYQISSFFSFQN